MTNLHGKTAIVTGGSRGIGRSIVLTLAKAGANVAIIYQHDSEAAEAVASKAREFEVEALTLKANVADQEQVDIVIRTALTTFKTIDILVNNAGIWKRNPIRKMSLQRLHETINVNVLGTYYPIISVVEHMVKRRSGVIINVSSTAGQRGEAYYSPYGTSKGAVIALTKSLASELAPHNVRVNCIAPGWFETDMSRESINQDVLDQIPMRRVGHPDELAAPVLFLASDMSSFVTGEVLNVNGGAVLCG